jgi:hypothetical protein
MKQSRQTREKPVNAHRTRSAPAAVAEPDPIAPPEPESSRVSFAVGPDGKAVDPERFRSKTKEALRAAYADEEFLKAIGITSTDDAEENFLLATISSASYDVLTVLMLLGARRAGYPIEQARVLAFTDAEKQTLQAPTARVIKKYIPNIGGKYRDEILLALALANVIGAKVMLLRETAAAAKAQAAQAGSTVAPDLTDAPPKPHEVAM